MDEKSLAPKNLEDYELSIRKRSESIYPSFQEKVKLTKPLHITVQDVDTELSIN